MVRRTRSNIRQRPKQTKEPPHALFDDIDEQPRISSLSKLTGNDRRKKSETARRDWMARRAVTTAALLHRRVSKRHSTDDDLGSDDRVYTEVLMDLDEEDNVGHGGINSGSGPDSWEEEEATSEEVLIYISTKGGLQEYEFTSSRVRKTKAAVTQARWDEEMPELVEAYLDYCFRRQKGQAYEGVLKENHTMTVWSTHGHSTYEVPIYSSDRWHNTSYIRSGLLPFNTLVNTSVVSLQTIELYHHLFMRCPRLGMQPFIRALCDMQGTRYQTHLSVQFTSAYDLYIRLVAAARSQVMKALDRDTPNWRITNACPPCQYEVIGENSLSISMFIAVDGNNSLKRMERQEPSVDGKAPGRVKDVLDGRVGGGDYFLQREEVDLWDEKNWAKWPRWTPSEGRKKVSCEDRWSNLKESKTSRSFGPFDINGIFAGFCRHSFVILILDMVKSGEQSKYMLALLHHFMTACSEDRKRRGLPELQGSLAVGYDIACGMINKIARSPLSNLAKDHRLQMLIGLLHAYGHNRLCQLTFLMLYIHGAGIEDLETCERYFAHSNSLAPVTRYMSKFHRRQAIGNYAYHRDNFETYANLSRFIYGNYKQALSIINRSKDTARILKDVGLLDDPTKAVNWLEEEREYLESRKTTPVVETIQTGYYLALVKLNKVQDQLQHSRRQFHEWNDFGTGDTEQEGHEQLFWTERQMWNAQEMEAKLLADVQAYEDRLGLRRPERWTPESEEWKKASELERTAKYQKALDKLEGLIVARIFELSKMNVSGTGYKMRQHIGQAMKKRSAAIQYALSDYNAAALALKPPRKVLDWTEVMNYTYLSEFDFLRDTRADVQEKTWSKPVVREAMSELFKLMRAKEEVDRLHVEIQRLYTYMAEEEEYTNKIAEEMEQWNPPLALQIRLQAQERQRFNGAHRFKLRNITKLKGFLPSNIHFFKPGIGLRRQGSSEAGSADVISGEGGSRNERDKDSDDEEDDGEAEDEANDRVEAILGIANDIPHANV